MLSEQDRDDLHHRLNQMLDKIQGEVDFMNPPRPHKIGIEWGLKRVREEIEKVL